MSRRKSKVVWHYTYQHNIKPILESQVLLPPCMCPGTIHNADVRQYGDTPGGAADAKLLLFSEREDWEPASYRGYRTWYGRVIDLHKLEEYVERGVAVFRIGVETRHLKPYTQLCRSVGMPKKMFDGLWKIAVRIGSNPYQWWGTTKPIPMSEWVSVEVFANGIWNNCFADDDAPTVGIEATL